MTWIDPTAIFWILVTIVASVVICALAALVSFKAAFIFYLIYAGIWFFLFLWGRRRV